MGTAAFGSGILKGLDVPGAIDLLSCLLVDLGGDEQSVAHLAESEQLEALLTLAAGGDVTFAWDAGREQLSIEAEDTDGWGGIARALGVLAVCLECPAIVTMLGEAGRSWRYFLADGVVRMRPVGMNFDRAVLTLNLSVLAADAVSGSDPGGCAT
jgi:hypothetical protein